MKEELEKDTYIFIYEGGSSTGAYLYLNIVNEYYARIGPKLQKAHTLLFRGGSNAIR